MKAKKNDNKRRLLGDINLKRRLYLFWSRLILIIKLSAVFLGLLFIFTDIFKGTKKNFQEQFYQISAEHGFQLKNILVHGQIYSDLDKILESINIHQGQSIFEISISDIKRKIENNPWIRSSIIQRRLPDTLYLAMFERKPIAIWQFNQKLSIIDEDGSPITEDNIRNFPNLLHIIGEGANIYAKNLIELLDQDPEIAKKVISATRYGSRRWDLQLEENIVVKMPENNIDLAFNYLSRLNKNNKLFSQRITTIDLRNNERYSIKKK